MFLRSALALIAATLLVTALQATRSSGARAQTPCAPPPLSDSQAWLPKTAVPGNAMPPPHPEPDCPFYKASWQRFLLATQPGTDGAPSLLSFATIEDVFGHDASPLFAKQSGGMLSLAPRAFKESNEPVPFQAGVQQAGPLRGLLIDQNGRPIYYAIHMNSDFVDFLRKNKLNSKDQLANISDSLALSPGVMELKSAWQIVSDSSPPENYITARARVPVLKVVSGQLTVTDQTRPVTVALLALHVVFALENHPELIWSTFEHIDAAGNRDNAPAAPANPSQVAGDVAVHAHSFPLFKGGTIGSAANLAPSNNDLIAHFDESAQAFNKGGTLFQTSVYRAFPGSKSDGRQPSDSAEDGDVADLNKNVRTQFRDAKLPHDKRQNYQLVGAVWINKPADFKLNRTFTNASNQTTDDPDSILAGEGRLSSTAMESFTQSEQFFPNCFSCHDTKAIRDDTTQAVIIKPKLLNVSHILSKFLSGAVSKNK